MTLHVYIFINLCNSVIYPHCCFYQVSNLNSLNVTDSDSESGKECDGVCSSDETHISESSCASTTENKLKSLTLPHKLDIKQIDWDELDDLLQVRLVFFFQCCVVLH